MTPHQADELLSQLKLKAVGLDELHERVQLLGGAWTRDQLELFLICARGVTRDDNGTFRAAGASVEGDLVAAIADAVYSFDGRPVPASQVRARLPQHFVTTDEQIRALAKRTPGLQLVGPGLIQATNGGMK